IFQFVKLSVLQNIFHLGNNSDSSYGTESSGLLLKIIGPLFARLSKKIHRLVLCWQQMYP
ncbi:hypothetical protein NE656_25195, partial [Flavonifractor plautii]|uniref:hypothetical protein n=1 Tax=Flavonifractor plautii TaxID=292800 RepID=UPI00210E6EF2